MNYAAIKTATSPTVRVCVCLSSFRDARITASAVSSLRRGTSAMESHFIMEHTNRYFPCWSRTISAA